VCWQALFAGGTVGFATGPASRFPAGADAAADADVDPAEDAGGDAAAAATVVASGGGGARHAGPLASAAAAEKAATTSAFEAALPCDVAAQVKRLGVLRPTFLLGFTGFWAALSGGHEAHLAHELGKALGCLVDAKLQAAASPAPEHESDGGTENGDDVDDGGGANSAAASVLSSPSLSVVAAAQSSPEWAACRAAFIATRRGGALRRELLSGCRAALGGCLLKAATGGSATPSRVRVFMAQLLADGNATNVLDAYGATEFPGIACNGVVSPDVELRLDPVPAAAGAGAGSASEAAWLFKGDDGTSSRPRGEIVVRRTAGKGAAASETGYWRQPALTAEKWLPGGWFRTGDVGELDYEAVVVPNTFAPVPRTADGRFARQPLLRVVDRVSALEEL
jgi:long-subunit acyl-CoA synthetase (AMP-forming)